MKKTLVVGALAFAALFLALTYFTDQSADRSSQPAASAKADRADSERAAKAANQQRDSASPSGAAPSSPAVAEATPSDPQLVRLMVSPPNDLIEFVRAPDGKVIKEIDKDPASLGYGKPSREYTFSGDKVIGLTTYRYFNDHVEVSRTDVAYKPDGSVDKMRESTSHQ
jgi:hypothetical protein